MAKRGDLTEAQILELLAACVANATDLLDEARLLSVNKHFPRAFVLAQLSGEEFTKALLLISLLLMRASGISPPMELFWSWWMDHDEKGSFQKVWEDMIASLNASDWMHQSLDPVKKLLLGSLGGLAAAWPSAQAHARSGSTWREDGTYVDFRNSTVWIPKRRIGRGRAKRKIDHVAAFGELIHSAATPSPSLEAIEGGEVPTFVHEVVEYLLTAQAARVSAADPINGSPPNPDVSTEG